MPLKSFSETISFGILVGAATFGLFFAAFWFEDKINEQDEDIEEIFSRLEDCENNLKK